MTPEELRRSLADCTMRWRSRQPIGHTTLPVEVQRLPDHERLAWFLGELALDGVDPAGLS